MSRFGHILWNGIRVGEWRREDRGHDFYGVESVHYLRVFVDRATDAHDKHSYVSGVDGNPLSFEFWFYSCWDGKIVEWRKSTAM